MARFLISTMPAHGHVNPVQAIVCKLVGLGHEVRWHTGVDFAAKVVSSGATFVPMKHAPSFEQLSRKPETGERGLGAINRGITRVFVEPTLGQLRDYEEILDSFAADVLLYDTIGMGPMLLHEKGGPPYATLATTSLVVKSADTPPWGAGRPPASSALGRTRNRFEHWIGSHVLCRRANKEFNQARRRSGLGPMPRGSALLDVIISPFLHLQCTTAGLEYPRRDLAPHIHLVGPILPPATAEFAPPDWWPELTEGRPVVFVTQGTVATNPNNLVTPALKALADDEVLIVVTTPKSELLEWLPTNARIERYIPYDHVLPYVDLMVTNGGFTGVKQALAHGVPIVGAGLTEDHGEVNARIAWSGVGIDLRTDTPTAAQIGTAIRAILSDRGYRDNARRIQAEINAHDTPAEVVDLLEQLAAIKAPVTRKRPTLA
ncbi:MAG: glycosyltransferase [Pseudonocardiaceae bacterium]